MYDLSMICDKFKFEALYPLQDCNSAGCRME